MTKAPVASIEVISSMGSDDPIGTLAIPLRDQMSAITAMSLMSTDFSWLGDRKLDRQFLQGSILPLQRNEAVARMRGDWLIFVDDDMSFQSDAIGDLVETYNEFSEGGRLPTIVGGLCVRRTPPHQPTLYMRESPNDGPWRMLEKWDTDVVEVDATGMAFVIIGVPVFEAILDGPFPPFDLRVQMGPAQFFEWTGAIGEDLRFCARAKECGTLIYVDTRIKIGHVGETVFTLDDYYRQVAKRSFEEEEIVRGVNAKYGLPVMTRDEARALIDD